MNIFKDILKPVIKAVAKTNPITGVLADVLLPDRVSEASGVHQSQVKKVIKALQGDPEITKAQMELEESLATLEVESQKVAADALKGLDTGVEFSWAKGLFGSPRRYGVTILATVISALIIVAGVRVIFGYPVAEKPEDFYLILKSAGATLSFLGGAYGLKYIGGKVNK